MSLSHLARRSSLLVNLCQRYSSTSAAASASQTAAPKKKTRAPSAPSSCPPDTLLKGLNYLKGQAPVLALPDDQYPDWLWTVLEPKQYPDDGPGGMAERMQRKKERQQAIKDRNFMSTQ